MRIDCAEGARYGFSPLRRAAATAAAAAAAAAVQSLRNTIFNCTRPSRITVPFYSCNLERASGRGGGPGKTRFRLSNLGRNAERTPRAS